MALLFLLAAVKSMSGMTLHSEIIGVDVMLNVSTDKIAVWVTLVFLLVAPFENIVRSEQFVYVIGVAVLLFCVLVKRHLFRNYSLLILVFMIYMFFATEWSPVQNGFGTMLASYAGFIFLYLQIQFDYTSEDYEKIKIAFILQNWILLALCFRFGSYMDSRFWLKSASSGADPNYLSGWFVIPLCFAVDYLFSEKTEIFVKLLLVIQIILSFYFIMQTASKSGLFINFLVVLLAGFYAVRKDVREHPVRAIAIVALLIGGFFFAINHMPAYLVSRIDSGVGTASGRLPMWKNLITTMWQHPLHSIVGFGTGSDRLYTGSKGMRAHNTYLDILFDYGVIGFLLILTYMIKGVKNKMNRQPHIIIAFLGLSVLLFTLSSFNTRFFVSILFLLGMQISDDGDEQVYDNVS